MKVPLVEFRSLTTTSVPRSKISQWWLETEPTGNLEIIVLNPADGGFFRLQFEGLAWSVLR